MSDTRNATPAEELEQRIMDPCVAKSEAEHWAAREIEKQRAEIERLRAEVERLRADRRERIATAVMAGLAACPNTRSSAEGVARSGLDGADALIALLDQERKP